MQKEEKFEVTVQYKIKWFLNAYSPKQFSSRRYFHRCLKVGVQHYYSHFSFPCCGNVFHVKILQFEEKLKEYGVDHYKELTLVEDRRNEGLNRGFAFLEFFSRLDAKLACRRLKNHEAAFGLDRKANVTFAVSYLEPDGKTMSEVGLCLILC